MSLSISPQSSTLAVGEILNLTLTVKAGPVKLTNVSIGGSGSKTTYHGLGLSPTYVATISQFPSDLSGFALAAFAVAKVRVPSDRCQSGDSEDHSIRHGEQCAWRDARVGRGAA